MRKSTPAVLAAASLLAAGACFAQTPAEPAAAPGMPAPAQPAPAAQPAPPAPPAAAAMPSVPPPAPPVTPPPAAPPPPAQLPPPDTGFFRPAADPSLTRPLPPPAPAPTAGAASTAQSASPPILLSEELQAELRAQTALDMLRWNEEQMDRAERESARARERALMGPAPINGAFTGLTDERSR